VTRWISITDNLPDQCAEVWAYDQDKGVTIAHLDQLGNWVDAHGEDYGLHDGRLYRVTHWQELVKPEPPTEQPEEPLYPFFGGHWRDFDG